MSETRFDFKAHTMPSTQNDIIIDGLKLTIGEAKIYMTLESNNPKNIKLPSISIDILVAHIIDLIQLGNASSLGIAPAPPDNLLARRCYNEAIAWYHYLLKDNKKQLNEILVHQIEQADEAFKKIEEETSSQFLKLLAWFTSTRLATLRADRVLNQFGFGFLQVIPSVIKNIGGLSYALELGIDLFEILKHTCWPKERELVRSSAWGRFKSMFTPERSSRMANAFVWFTINALAWFVLEPTIALIANFALFMFDVGHEIIKGIKEIQRHKSLLNKITAINEELKAELQTEKLAKGDLQELFLFNENLFQKLLLFTECKKELQTKIGGVQKKVYYAITTTTAVVVGMTLFFFPPAALGILCAKILGASIALIAGSVIAGLGKRLWDIVSGCFTRSKSNSLENTKKSQDISTDLINEQLPHKKQLSDVRIKFNNIPSTLASSGFFKKNKIPKNLSVSTMDSPYRKNSNAPIQSSEPFSPLKKRNRLLENSLTILKG